MWYKIMKIIQYSAVPKISKCSYYTHCQKSVKSKFFLDKHYYTTGCGKNKKKNGKKFT